MLGQCKPVRLFVIDIEASGLSTGSYPVEVAVQEIGGETKGEWMVRPEPGWTRWHWDEDAAMMHGISREETERAGMCARDVCKELRQLLGDGRLFSDAHVYDQQWLDRLIEAEWPPCSHLSIAPVFSLVPMARRAAFGEALDELDRPHRAGKDAAAIALCLSKFLRIPH